MLVLGISGRCNLLVGKREQIYFLPVSVDLSEIA